MNALLSTAEVADLLGVSERFVRDLVYRGELEFHRIGKGYRFAVGDVERWVAGRRVERRRRTLRAV